MSKEPKWFDKLLCKLFGHSKWELVDDPIELRTKYFICKRCKGRV